MSDVGRSMLKLTPGMAPGAECNEPLLEVPVIALSTAEEVVHQLLEAPLLKDRYGDSVTDQDREALRAWVEANLPAAQAPLLVPPSLDALRSWWAAQRARASLPARPEGSKDGERAAEARTHAPTTKEKLDAARRTLAGLRTHQTASEYHGVLSGPALDRVLALVAPILRTDFAQASVESRAAVIADAIVEGVDPAELRAALGSFSGAIALRHLEAALERAGIDHAGPCAFRALRSIEATAAQGAVLRLEPKTEIPALPIPAENAQGTVVSLEAIARASESLRASELAPHLASAQLAHAVRAEVGRGDAIDFGPLLAQFSTQEELFETLTLILRRSEVPDPDEVARAFVQHELATLLFSKRIVEPLRALAQQRARESIAMLDTLLHSPGALDALLDGLAQEGQAPDRVRDALGQLGIRAPSRLHVIVDLRAPVAALLDAPRTEQRETLLGWIRESRRDLEALRGSLKNAMFQRDLANFLGQDADRFVDLRDLSIEEISGPPRNVAHALIAEQLDARDPDEARGWVAFFTGAVIGYSTAGLGRALDVALGGTVGGLPTYLEKLIEADRVEKRASLGLANASAAGQLRSVALAELGVGIAAGGLLDQLMHAVQSVDDVVEGARRLAQPARTYDEVMPANLLGDSERDTAVGPLVQAAARELAFVPGPQEAARHRLGLAVASVVLEAMKPKPGAILRSLGLSDAERATVLTLYCATMGETLPALRARDPKAFPRRVAEDLRALCEGLRLIGGRSEPS